MPLVGIVELIEYGMALLSINPANCNEAVYPFPFRDLGVFAVQDVIDRTAGQNPQVGPLLGELLQSFMRGFARLCAETPQLLREPAADRVALLDVPVHSMDPHLAIVDHVSRIGHHARVG
jgi:hypothetical protein